ncbi:unnamed protein product, partial [Meganyctiphanes norvegica]
MDGKRSSGGDSAPNKKFRGGDEDEDVDMDFEMAGMDEEMNEDMGMDDLNVACADIEDSEDGNSKWTRPAPPVINSKKERFIFHQCEIDYTIGTPKEGMPGQQAGRVPIMRMFGVTDEGNSVCCHVHGFSPYFYVTCPLSFKQEHLGPFKNTLNKIILDDMRSNRENIKETVLAVDICTKENIYGFHGNRKARFLKITVVLPRLIAAAKRLLGDGKVEVPGLGCPAYEAYESNIDFEIRFMVDTKVVGCCWIELSPDKYSVRKRKEFTTRCQIELDVGWNKFIAHEPEGEWSRVAPFRILSFDIECAGRKGVFPEPEKDPVIQIGNMVQCQGETEPFIRAIFTLKDCDPIVGAKVISCDQERDMLEKWSAFVRQVDPDIITGYNINNFDFPYVIDRAKALKSTTFSHLGRVKGMQSMVKVTTLQSKQMGKRENKSVNIEGRCQFDLILVLLRDYKLRSYTLNAVSFHFLGEQKEDVHHSIISDLQNESSTTRRRLAVYCLKDSLLPLRLLDKLMCIINYMEMARVTGVPLTWLLTRGQQIKVVSQLLRKAMEQDLILPAHKGQGSDEFEGATVIEPRRGYYDVPIATLDFSSLYPSIMMAHNLCYTTLLSSPQKASEYDTDASDIVGVHCRKFYINEPLKKG